jgi:pimeloyl-ACP methyl ester carboxylesterase
VKPETKRALRWLWILPALRLIAVLGFVAWGLTPLGPTDLALEALKSGNGVTVTQAAGGWAFSPSSTEPTAALVLYPGGHVDARSYAPLAREIASRGYLVVVPRVPLSLAFFDINAADKARSAFPDIKTWVVGGHSLGGVAAALYAKSNPLATRGLVLYASYPAGGADFSKSDLAAASITGTLDGVINRQSLAASYPLLPADTDRTPIVGGNHGQFGSYGPQPGDNPATITPQQQWTLAADAAQGVLSRAASRR